MLQAIAGAMSPRRTWVVPSPADVIFGITLAVATIVRGWFAINTDGDLPRHLRVGSEILSHGLFFTDRFSWTMQGQPFVPYEWASEVLYTLAHRMAGLPGVILLMGVALAAAYALLYRLMMKLGMDPLLAMLTSIAAAAAGSFHWLARPHVFSYGAVVGLVWLMEVAGHGSRDPRLVTRDSRLILVLPLFAIWANLHAGFLFGLVLIGMYLVGDVLEQWVPLSAVRGPSRIKRDAMLLVAALVGTCINPSGPGVIVHVASYFQKGWLVDITNEMQSPDFHAFIGRTFLVLLLVCLAVLGRSGRRPSWQHLIVFLGTTAFALESKRHIALWALTGFPLLMLHANASWTAAGWEPFARLREGMARGAGLAHAGAWSLVPLTILAIAAARGGMLGGARLMPDRFDPTAFPVRIVGHARAANIQGRMFNDFVWGGYILYAWPEQKVFIDGQSDFYGVPLNQLYMSIRQADPGWERRLDSLGVDMVLLPASAPASRALLDAPGWTMADSADGAVRYERR
jgi:hypothetical protein